jgi:two-component system cell cycle response regulator
VKSIGEAFDRLDENSFDLIFLDYLLPDGNGLDFLEAINTKRVETPVVVITGQGDELIASGSSRPVLMTIFPKPR